MQHADKIVERHHLPSTGFPNMQVIDPLHIGQKREGGASTGDLCGRDVGAPPALYQGGPRPICHAVQGTTSAANPVREADARRRRATSIISRPSSISSPSSALELYYYAQHHMGKTDDDHAGLTDAARAVDLRSLRVGPAAICGCIGREAVATA